jgi:hydroxyacylglutathione hydrolase
MQPRIWSRELGSFATNCYILACPETGEAAVIDPGTPDPWIKQVLVSQGLKVSAIWLTHGHVDHIGGVEWVRSFSGAPIWVHAEDEVMLADPMLNGSSFFGPAVIAPGPDRRFTEDEPVTLGRLSFTVIHTPGHTPGGIGLYTPGHLIGGDTLFAGSIGRTDLPGGDFATIIRSIKERLLPLPPETVVYPGHGPTTTIGDEKEYNPFIA